MNDQGEAAKTPEKRFPRWRRITSWIALIVAAVLVPLSVISVFVRNQVLDTGHYVDTLHPLAHNPAIQEAAATRITNLLMDQVDVEALAEEALPARARSFAPALATGVQTFVQTATEKILASDQFQTFWDQANRITHAQVVRLLTGDTGPVDVVDGKVQLDLGPTVEQVKAKLVDSGLSFLKGVDTARLDAKITLFQAENLETAQTGTKALKATAIILPILAVLLFAAAVVLAKDRRRALVRVGLATAFAAALLSVALALSRSIYLDAVSSFVISRDAAKAVFDTVVRDIKRADRALIVLGLLTVLGATLAGPSRGAVWVRGLFTGGADKAGEHMGENKVNAFVAQHLMVLRLTIVAIAAAILVVWDQPGPWTVFALALFVLIAFGAIEVVARAHKSPAVEAPESS